MEVLKKSLKSNQGQRIVAVCVVLVFLWKSTAKDRGERKAATVQGQIQSRRKKNFKGGNVDAEFWRRIKALLKIAVPNYSCKEFKYIIILTLLLALRTQMSIWLADVNGRIVKSIIELNFNKFVYRIFNLMMFSIPSSAVNSGMDYFAKLLAVAFRERITHYFHSSYLNKMFYYKICNLDSRI